MTAVEEIAEFFNAMSPRLPGSLELSIDPNVVIMQDTDGEAQQFLFLTGLPTIATGISGTPYAAPAGAMIQWETGAVVRGRRLRGRTFLVPLASNAFQADGTLSAATMDDLGDAAEVITRTTGAQFLVWSRPVRAAGGAITEEGLSRRINSATIPDRAAILTSRRRAVR